MHKFLIYGGKGWIGNKFLNFCLDKDCEIVLGNSRVDNISTLREEIVTIQPTNVISFIGRTHGEIDGKKYTTIDYLEQDGKLEENIKDNLFSPMVLAIICNRYNIHLTYLGTGCIFSYLDSENSSEPYQFKDNDEPNFFGSSYSIVKGFTDRLMHLYSDSDSNSDSVLNLRIRMPITNIDEPRNFISKIIRYPKICSISNSMTVLNDFIPIFYDMIINKRTGTYNCTNPGVISHNQILEMYQKYIDSDFTWENFTEQEQNKILDSKRSNNYLDTTKIHKMYPYLQQIDKSINNVLKNWKK
jgi:dTDP-4-dehydrorhamnose reductase